MAAAPKIDRMIVELPGGSADQGRQVALLVAAGLAAAGALPQSGDLPHIRVTISGSPKSDPISLARRIVQATLRELALTP
jgi:hypothetical protein